MEVDRVKATLRYSAEAKGAWRSLEIGAEATVAPDEDWHTAQASLYHQLGQQLQALWDNRRAEEAPGKPAEVSEEATCPLRLSTIASSTRSNTGAMRRRARCYGHTRLRMAHGVKSLDMLSRRPLPSDLTLQRPKGNSLISSPHPLPPGAVIPWSR